MPRRRTASPKAASSKPATPTASQRVRHLVLLDAANVMRRLQLRGREMVALFSRLRTRAPMLETVHSWFSTVSFAELVALEPFEQAAVNAFYEQLGALRWYLQYTEDMPTQLQQELARQLALLELAHRKLTEVVGPADAQGAEVIDVEVVTTEAPPGTGPLARRKR